MLRWVNNKFFVKTRKKEKRKKKHSSLNKYVWDTVILKTVYRIADSSQILSKAGFGACLGSARVNG